MRKLPRVKKEKKSHLLRVKLRQPPTGISIMSWRTSKEEGLSNMKCHLYSGFNNRLLHPYLSTLNFCNPPTLLPLLPQSSFATRLLPCINMKKVPSRTFKKTDSTPQPQSVQAWASNEKAWTSNPSIEV